jgi:hypothetical protein
MGKVGKAVAVGVLAVLATGCVTYSSVSKANDGKVWLSGATSYWFITVPFIKRCDADGTILHCEELNEYTPPAANRRGGGGGGGGGEEKKTTEESAPPAPAPTHDAGAKK